MMRATSNGSSLKSNVRKSFSSRLEFLSFHTAWANGGSKYACVQCEIPAAFPFRKTSRRSPILVGLTHKLMRKYSAYARGEPSIPVVFRCRIDGPRGPQHGRAT